MNKENNIRFRGSNALAFVPIVIFLFFCVIYSIYFKTFEMYALAMGAFVGLLLGSILVVKKDYDKYWSWVYKGANEALPIVILLFIIGMFSAMIKASNISQGFVWLADSIGISGRFFTGFVFLAVCIIASASGSSIGTMFTCFPIFYPAGIILGCNPSMLAGAIVSGGIFGDNLSPISDTTIISAGSQEYKNKEGFAEVGACVSSRFKYSFTAGVISLIIYIVFGGGEDTIVSNLASDYSPNSLIMIIPVIIMLIVSIKTRNIYKALIVGLISGSIIGILSGVISFEQIISVNEDSSPSGFLTDGINSMLATSALIISVYGIMGVLNGAGTLENISKKILDSSAGQDVKKTELIMMAGISFTTLLFGGVTSAAMATFGKIQNEIGKKLGLHPYRRAYLLDGFANAIVLTVPFLSVFVFIGSMLSQGYDFVEPLSLFEVSKGLIYSFVLFFVLLFSIFTGWKREYEGENGQVVLEKN